MIASHFTRHGFVSLVARLPGTSLHEQWGSLVAKVGDKVFSLQGDDGSLVFKCTEIAFEGLTLCEGAMQAPYFAKRQWVRVTPLAGLGEGEAEAYLCEAHAIIAGKLTRKRRTELGLTSAMPARSGTR